MTRKRVVAVVISIWLFSAFFALILLCIPVLMMFTIIAIIFGLCLICTTIVHLRIYFAVRRHTNQIKALQVQQVAQNGEMVNIARLKKSAISTLYVYLVFLVCNVPEYCRLVATIIRQLQSNTSQFHCFSLYSWTLVFLNSSLKPVIYCWKMRHIRHAIVDILRNIFPSQN